MRDTTRSASPSFAPQAAYIATPVGVCNVSCGDGWQNTTLSCVDRRQQAVPLSACANAPTVPTPVVPCRAQACDSYELVRGLFSSCAPSCGNGTMTRTLACRSHLTGAPVPLSSCIGTAPGSVATDTDASRPCFTPCGRLYR